MKSQTEKPHGNFPARPEFGAYIIREPKGTPDLILFSDALNLQLQYDISDILAVQGYTVRIVILSDDERFRAQSEDYRKSVFSLEIPLVAGIARDEVQSGIYGAYTQNVLWSSTSKTELARQAMAILRGEEY